MRFARPVGYIVLALLTVGLVAGCDKDAKWYGSYKNTKDNSVLVLQADHKGTLDAQGTKADVTWEVTGDDKATVHVPFPIAIFRTSDGNLRDEEGTIWKRT